MSRIRLAIVVLIITGAILGCAYVLLFQGGEKPAPLLTCKSDLADLRSQLEYYREEQGSYPSTRQGLNALITMPNDVPSQKDWHQRLRVLPTDPWKHPYQYVYPGRRNTKGFDLYSFGPDGLQSDDDIYANSP